VKIYVIDITSLTDLTGLDNLTSIGGSLELHQNVSILNFTGLQNLTSIGENLNISYNDSLENFEGLLNLSAIGGGMYIGHNDALIDFTGLNNVNSINGTIEIDWNENLNSFEGLQSLNTIVGYLTIEVNNSLNSLAGLYNLTSLGGHLAIDRNNSLFSLEGLGNIEPQSISDLYIYDNSLLSSCAVQSICDYLVSPNGNVMIENNAPGCNSLEEVQEACETLAIPSVDAQAVTLFYPNPAESFIFVKGTSQSVVQQVSIYNQMGQRVLQKEEAAGPVDVSRLLPGMYVIEIFSGELRIREKLIIQ